MHLLDASVLIPLTLENHVHHTAARRWWGIESGLFATCPITQGSLARALIREGWTGSEVKAGIQALGAHPRHRFWPDELSYEMVDLARVLGHAQVTDTYLAELARRREAKIATLDRGLAEREPDVTTLIPGE